MLLRIWLRVRDAGGQGAPPGWCPSLGTPVQPLPVTGSSGSPKSAAPRWCHDARMGPRSDPVGWSGVTGALGSRGCVDGPLVAGPGDAPRRTPWVTGPPVCVSLGAPGSGSRWRRDVGCWVLLHCPPRAAREQGGLRRGRGRAGVLLQPGPPARLRAAVLPPRRYK